LHSSYGSLVSEMPEQSDARLIERCRAGENAAWDVLVHRYKKLIYTVPRRAGLDEHSSSDVFQSVFCSLIKALDKIEDPSRIRAWLVTTAMRETLALLRSRKADRVPNSFHRDEADEDPASFEIPDESPDAEQQLIALQEASLVSRALGAIDEKSRTLLFNLFVRDPPMTYEEISLVMNITIGSIGPTRSRALEKLRLAYKEIL
jgi:RNA polymerase sigma factor (sigma-70 family)